MFVPFFSVDDDLTALNKLKVLFVVRRIRNVDIFLFFLWVIPFIVNFIYYILIKGSNNPLALLNPFSALFNGAENYDPREWNTFFGYTNIVILLVSAVIRAMAAVPLYRQMIDFEKNNVPFKWNKKSKFWLTIFLPFMSFVVYPILFKMSDFELMHKYNL